MAVITIKPCGGGVVKDVPPSELTANQWSDALNVRFFNGIAQRRGGIREGGWTTPTVIPYALETFITSTGSRFLVQAGLQKVFVDDGSNRTEITRYTDGQVISSITRAGTTATLTTATNHGLSTGNSVTVFGAVPTGYNGTYTITVTGATTFTYTMAADPGSSATTVGQYSYNVTSNFTGAIDDKWTLSVLGGILILNNPVDGPYYWNGDTTTRMRRLPGWLAGEKAYAMRSFKNFLIALAPTTGGTFYPHQIKWSTSVEAGSIPTTWTAANTNDAGDTPQSAEVGGFLVDGMGLGEEFIAYKDDGIFALSYIGGNEVFSLRRIPGRFGLRTRHAIVETPLGHVFLANGDLRLHSGGVSRSIIEGKIRHWINRSIDGSYSARSFLALNAPWSEVWLVFPSNGATVPNTVCAWNWNDDTWAIFEIPPTTCAATGLIADGVDSESWDDSTLTWATLLERWYEYLYSPNELRLILGLNTPKLGLADTGSDDLGTAITWRLEKRGSALDDNDSMKVVSRSRPQFTSTAGAVVSCYHATTTEASDEPSYPSAVSYTIGTTNWVNKFSKAGRFLHIKYEGSSSGAVVLRSYDVEFSRQGRF
jgi:hypothetical protein